MAITRARKEEIVAQYTDMLERSTGFIVTEYRGMKVSRLNELRAALREQASSYVVTKNRLFKIALDSLGMPVPDDLLNGPVAVSFAYTDLPATVKTLLDQRKTNELLILKGGVIGNSVIGESDLQAISELPSLDELRAQILGMLTQPTQGLVNVLNAPPQNLVNVLSAGVSSVADVLAAYVAKQENEAA
ncbi:MAG: 50S ribosomal protein L10 [Anaerolineales bacterium]